MYHVGLVPQEEKSVSRKAWRVKVEAERTMTALLQVSPDQWSWRSEVQ